VADPSTYGRDRNREVVEGLMEIRVHFMLLLASFGQKSPPLDRPLSKGGASGGLKGASDPPKSTATEDAGGLSWFGSTGRCRRRAGSGYG
jgi:hypothetical protein